MCFVCAQWTVRLAGTLAKSWQHSREMQVVMWIVQRVRIEINYNNYNFVLLLLLLLLLLLTKLTIQTYLQFISIKNMYIFKHENEALVPVLHQIKFHTCVLSLNSLDSLGLLSSSCNECSPEVDRVKLLFQFKSQFTLRAL